LGYTVFTYFYVLNYLLKIMFKWCEYNPTVENSKENWKLVCKLASIIQTTGHTTVQSSLNMALLLQEIINKNLMVDGPVAIV